MTHFAAGLAPPPPKICIPFVAVLKKSKKRQAKTLLLKIRSTPIALAALPADFCIFSVPPLCQFSSEKHNDFLKSCSNL